MTTPTHLIDAPQVLATLREIVAEQEPGYKYTEEECQYHYDGKPSCIVGHVLARVGLLDQTPAHDNVPACDLEGFTNRALSLLRKAQIVQDGKYMTGGISAIIDTRGTWADALEAAEMWHSYMDEVSE